MSYEDKNMGFDFVCLSKTNLIRKGEKLNCFKIVNKTNDVSYLRPKEVESLMLEGYRIQNLRKGIRGIAFDNPVKKLFYVGSDGHIQAANEDGTVSLTRFFRMDYTFAKSELEILKYQLEEIIYNFKKKYSYYVFFDTKNTYVKTSIKKLSDTEFYGKIKFRITFKSQNLWYTMVMEYEGTNKSFNTMNCDLSLYILDRDRKINVVYIIDKVKDIKFVDKCSCEDAIDVFENLVYLYASYVR